ncbi:hypothetical protein YN1_3010 [Nanoarchaeota archaeon]
MISDIYRWHIDVQEKRNEKESYYIHCLINFWSMKLNEKYKTILDIPSGHGRLHKYLRLYGYDIYGVDISKELIEIAKNNYKGYEDHYFIGDMRDFKLNKKVDVILNWFTSFGYFNDEDNIKTLNNFYENLRDNGLLILEFDNFYIQEFNREFILNYKEVLEIDKVVQDEDPKFLFFDEKFYKKQGEDLIFIGKEKIKVRKYYVEDFINLLSGKFEILSIYKTLSFNDFERNRDGRFTIVAKKLS